MTERPLLQHENLSLDFASKVDNSEANFPQIVTTIPARKFSQHVRKFFHEDFCGHFITRTFT